MKDILDALARIKPPPKPLSGRIFSVCVIAIYPIWGLLSSAMLLNAGLFHTMVGRALAGIVCAGILPVALHLYEVKIGKESFEWKTVFICLVFGGIVTVFLGSILQGLLLLCGIHSLVGLRIDMWYWKLPDWMFQSDYGLP